MAHYLVVLALSVICVNSAMIPRQFHSIKDLSPTPTTPELFKRDADVSTNGPFKREFNFTTGTLGEEILVQRDDGLRITCIDRRLEAQFTLEMDFDIDDNLLNQLAAALLPQISTLESSAQSVATSVANAGIAGATSIVSQAIPITTSIVHEASSVAHGVIASAASPIVSAAAQVTADVASIASGAADDIKSAVPFLGNLFDRRDLHIIPQDANILTTDVLRGFNISITQQSPILANFNLDIKTGDQDFEVNLPTVSFGSLPTFPPSIIQLGIFELQIVFSPLALTSMISMQSNMNVSLSFGAGLAVKEPIQINRNGFQETGIESTSRFGDSVVSGRDPALCISAVLGPVIKFSLRIPSANVGVELKAQLEMPRVATCFDQVQNVDQNCRLDGSIADALHINSNMSVGISSDISYALPVDLGMVLPDPPQLPQISAVFPPFEKCLDLGGTN